VLIFQAALTLSDCFDRTHVELFPNGRELKEDLVDELRDIILHAAGGVWIERFIVLDAHDHLNKMR
jgi:hypothetical protein